MEKRKEDILNTFRGLLWMLVLAGLTVIFLAAGNLFPSLVQQGFVQQYDNLEDAKRTAGFERVLVPSFFPEGITWPPHIIFAQKKPYQAVVMEFKAGKTDRTSLIVMQSSWQGSDKQLQSISLTEKKEETRYRLKGRNVLLQVGICEGKIPCSRMTWQDDTIHHTVLILSTPFELIRLVESMIR